MSEKIRRYVIITPFSKADVLAGICKLHDLDVWVLPCGDGTLVVHDLPVVTFDEWDISELLGPDATSEPVADPENEKPANPADDPDHAARLLSGLSRAGVVLLTAELGEDVGNEAGVSGVVTAVQYDGQGQTRDIPAGLIVATSEQLLEDLLIAEQNPDQVKGAIRSADIEPTMLHKMASRDSGDDTEKPAPEDKKLPRKSPKRFFGKKNK